MFSYNKPWNENYHGSTFIHRYANKPEVSSHSGIFLNFPPKKGSSNWKFWTWKDMKIVECIKIVLRQLFSV